MNWVIAIAVLTCTAGGGGFMLIVRRLANRPKGSLPVTAEWIDDLSIERYRPMIRLLDGEDLEFLRAQPGYTPKMASRLRIQRCQIFRGYLRCLHTDFKRVCIAIKVLMLQSGHDREDLASALVRSQMQFALGMARVQVQLMLYRWGLSGVDVGELLSVFDVMRLELRSLVPAGIEA